MSYLDHLVCLINVLLLYVRNLLYMNMGLTLNGDLFVKEHYKNNKTPDAAAERLISDLGIISDWDERNLVSLNCLKNPISSPINSTQIFEAPIPYSSRVFICRLLQH